MPDDSKDMKKNDIILPEGSADEIDPDELQSELETNGIKPEKSDDFFHDPLNPNQDGSPGAGGEIDLGGNIESGTSNFEQFSQKETGTLLETAGIASDVDELKKEVRGALDETGAEGDGEISEETKKRLQEKGEGFLQAMADKLPGKARKTLLALIAVTKLMGAGGMAIGAAAIAAPEMVQAQTFEIARDFGKEMIRYHIDSMRAQFGMYGEAVLAQAENQAFYDGQVNQAAFEMNAAVNQAMTQAAGMPEEQAKRHIQATWDMHSKRIESIIRQAYTRSISMIQSDQKRIENEHEAQQKRIYNIGSSAGKRVINELPRGAREIIHILGIGL